MVIAACFIKGKEMVEDKFDSFSEFVEQATTGTSSLNTEVRSSRRADRNGWAGGSWETCVELARLGWIDGAKKIEEMAAPLLAAVTTHMRRQEVVFDIQGDTVDIGTFMTGNPEPFIRWEETEVSANARGKFVHIVCNVAASSFFTTQQLFKKGAAVVAVADALEMTGHRVTIDVVQMVGGRGYFGNYRITGDSSSDKYMLTVRLKNPEDPLNLETVAFACAHSGMLRRLVFSVEEQQTKEILTRFGFGGSGGYGIPEDPQRKIECDIYVGASNSDVINDPLGWAKRQLVAQGVEFTE